MAAHQPDLFAMDTPPWELDAQGESRAARIVFSEAPHGPFDYLVPDALHAEVRLGVRVTVPLGRSNRPMLGYCIGVETIRKPPDALKPVIEVLDSEPLCTPRVLELLQWISRYYLTPLGQVFEAAIPAGVRAAAGSRQRTVLYPVAGAEVRFAQKLTTLSSKQQAAWQQLVLTGGGVTIDQLQKLANCSAAPINALREAGLIEARQERWIDELTVPASPQGALPLALSVDQRQALQVILGALKTGKQETILLHGITGSGKTEVYMQAIHEVLTYGRQAIVLVPEISLTPQTRQRFVTRFGQVAVLHSHMSGVERHHQWRKIAAGHAKVVIGPRSAIFAPVPQLGLIVVDEEHESSFKQDTLPRYHARDVALHRSFLEQIPVVLGSATPSLESWHRAVTGKYMLASLPRRIHNRPLPHVTTIDLRQQRIEPGRGAITRQLSEAITDTLQGNGQIMLLLNRRGFATTIQCPQCGFVVACPDCDLPLTHHRDGNKACCHYCDYQIAAPPVCPKCGADSMRFGGLGTQRLEVEVKARFPQARIARMDSDTMRKPGSHERVLSEFRDGKIQILLGTQMIAKGLDFPNVLLVGVINADSALHFPDFRSAEKTFQIVTQVAGRTGRGEKAGQVLVQTFSPEHPAIIAASRHDFVGFANSELAQRAHFGYPPHGHIARIIMRGEDQSETEAFAESFVKKLQASRQLMGIECRILGPAPPPLSRLRGKYRFHALLQALEAEPLNRLLVRTVSEVKPPKDVQYVIDVDPQDTL
ncbi:MAG: primosomal protein N' [Planctomycetales bacterium]|nr:primosomal protein N' [Planctomycetales bacterium]